MGGTPNEFHKLGAKGFINKPYDMKVMLQKVRKIMDED